MLISLSDTNTRLWYGQSKGLVINHVWDINVKLTLNYIFSIYNLLFMYEVVSFCIFKTSHSDFLKFKAATGNIIWF